MKKIIKFFSPLLLIGVVLISCGSDDNHRPAGVLNTVNDKKYVYTIPLEGIKNQTSENEEPYVLSLSEIVGEIAAKNFASNEARIDRGKTYIKIEGLSDVSSDVTLQDFSIRVGGRKYVNLGNCNPMNVGNNSFQSDKELSSDKFTNIVLDIFEDLKNNKDKKVNIWVSFKPTETITENTYNVSLKIKLEFDYKYYTYP